MFNLFLKQLTKVTTYIARIFFTGFSKGLDRVDHNVLMANLQKLNIKQSYAVTSLLSNIINIHRLFYLWHNVNNC